MAKGVLLSLALIALWAVVQIAVIHATRPVRLFFAITALFGATIPVYVAVYLLTPPDLYVLSAAVAGTPATLGLANGLLVHVLLYCTWMEAFYYVDRPVTLRILVEFVKAPGGYLTLSDMRRVYGLEQMIVWRLESMRTNGYVVERDGRFTLTRKGRVFAIGISMVRRFLGVPYYFDVVPAGQPRGFSGTREPIRG